MLSSMSQLNQDIIQNARGELTCWPTFDKFTEAHTHTTAFSLIFIQITTTIPNETKCIMLENTGTEEWFLSTQRIRKAEYAGTLVWYCAHWTEPVIQQCIQQVGWKLKKKREKLPPSCLLYVCPHCDHVSHDAFLCGKETSGDQKKSACAPTLANITQSIQSYKSLQDLFIKKF